LDQKILIRRQFFHVTILQDYLNLIEGEMMPGGRAINMPKDGMASAEMTDAYRGALAKAIEQALVVLRTEAK
jgi:hypothetical protein